MDHHADQSLVGPAPPGDTQTRIHVRVAVCAGVPAVFGVGWLCLMDLQDAAGTPSVVDEFYALILTATAVCALVSMGALTLRWTVRAALAPVVAELAAHRAELAATRVAVQELARKIPGYADAIADALELKSSAGPVHDATVTRLRQRNSRRAADEVTPR